MVYQRIRRIERATHFDLLDKTMLLLVYARQKPAAYIGMRTSLDAVPALLPSLGKFFDGLDLHSWSSVRTTSNPTYSQHDDSYLDILVASQPSDLERAVRSFDPRDDEAFGQAMGYPQTAIDAHQGKRERFWGNMLRDGKPHSFFIHQTFILSQDYFKEEINEPCMRWHDTVRRLSPRLYKKITAHMQDRKGIELYPACMKR